MKIVVSRLSALFLTVFFVIGNSILIELILDVYGVKGHRLFTGTLGTSLIILSFLYSMRKGIFKLGRIKFWLKLHEWLAIAGSVIIFVHTGTHFHAIVPIITLVFMFTAFISGLIGRYVYDNTRAKLSLMKDGLKKEGLSDDEIEDRLSTLTAASKALARWRDFHLPVISILAVMVIYHVISALYFGGF